MRKTAMALLVLIVLIVALLFLTDDRGYNINKLTTMKITSLAFTEGEPIPPRYTCDGENLSPPLMISDVPEGAAELVLIMDDPDAPMGIWVHWTMWGISPQTSEIPESNIPEGAVQGVTSFGNSGYGGPCPPTGAHRYFFKLYALKERLSLSPETTKEQLQAAMKDKILSETQFMGTYAKKTS